MDFILIAKLLLLNLNVITNEQIWWKKGGNESLESLKFDSTFISKAFLLISWTGKTLLAWSRDSECEKFTSEVFVCRQKLKGFE